MADIFLSYDSEDRERIRPLVDTLITAGFSVWWDRRIDVGATFDREIERELEAASCVIVVWSHYSIDSDWVREEALDGLNRNILVPVQIDECRFPIGFRRAQTASLIGWPDTEGELEQLLRRISELVRTGSNSSNSMPAVQSTAGNDTAMDRSIAVLPFANMSADPDNVYFSDGISEEILNGLVKLSGIKVIARTSSFRFRENRDIREIGELLGVTHVLEGSVRKAGNRVRITAQLIKTDDGVHVWSESYSRELEDIFEVQEEISRTIITELKASLLAHPPAPHVVVDPQAYDAYLLGNFHKIRYEIDLAIANYERAVEIEPRFADALGALARVHHLRLWVDVQPGPALRAIEDYSNRALEVDANEPAALAVRATKLFFADRQYQTALDQFHDLLIRFPNHEAVVSNAKNPLSAIGRFDLAVRLAERLVELDPLSPFALEQKGLILRGLGRFAEAETTLLRGVQLGGSVSINLVFAALEQGAIDRTQEYFDKLAPALGTNTATYYSVAASIAAASSRMEEARGFARQVLEVNRTKYVPPWALLQASRVLGDDAWIQHIQQGLDERHYGLLNLLRPWKAHETLPQWRAVSWEHDPRYLAILQSVGLDDASVARLNVPDLPF